MLSDWTDPDPVALLATLKRNSDYFNFHEPTAVDFIRDVERLGVRGALARRRMWNRMRMNPTDLGDVSAYGCTYLLNGTTPAGNWTALFKPGERVRLRFTNGSAMTYFDVRIPGLKLTVVSADGQDVEPVTVDEFRIGVGETYDVLVQPADAAYTLFAEAIDRSGYARGTLAPQAGLKAPLPPLDPPLWLGMSDMMGMDMSAMPGMDMSGAKPTGGLAMPYGSRGRHVRRQPAQ